MTHKIVEKEKKLVEEMSKELQELKEQEELDKKQKELQKALGKQKFWMKHHTLQETVEGVKSGTKGYLMFVRKDVAPAMVKGMHMVMKEWKSRKAPSDKEIRESLKEGA